jgi:hypothetical protein
MHIANRISQLSFIALAVLQLIGYSLLLVSLHSHLRRVLKIID